MGSEQSSLTADTRSVLGETDEVIDTTATSPDSSICSDHLPMHHVRPIGSGEEGSERVRRFRSVQRQFRSTIRSKLQSSSLSSTVAPPGVVVVNSAPSSSSSLSQQEHLGDDAELARLQALPVIQPVIRGVISSYQHAVSQHVLEGLDVEAPAHMSHVLQQHLSCLARHTATNQHHLVDKINQLDSVLSGIEAELTNRQRTFSQHASQLRLVEQLQRSVSSCCQLADQCCQMVFEVNSRLPSSLQLDSIKTDQLIRK